MIDVELQAMYYRALSHDDHAEPERAVELYRAAVTRAEGAGLLWSPWGTNARVRLLALRYVIGDWPGEHEQDRPGTLVSDTVVAALNSTWVHLSIARGRFEAAERLLDELHRHRDGDLWIAMAVAAGAVEVAFWRGEHRAAAEAAHTGMDRLERTFPERLVGIRIACLGIEACAAWSAAARLRGDSAAAAAAEETGTRLLTRARECLRSGRPRSGTLGREGQAWFLRARAAASGLAGHADPRLWAAAVEEFGFGAVYEQALCRWHYAEAVLASGAPDQAAQALRAAYEQARRLGAAPLCSAVDDLARRARIDPPTRRDPPRSVLDPLTARERSVLERVAEGLTNKQVGDRLYISEKTVSVHLSRVMGKLGASRRAEAVAIAYDRGLLVADTSEARRG